MKKLAKQKANRDRKAAKEEADTNHLPESYFGDVDADARRYPEQGVPQPKKQGKRATSKDTMRFPETQ